MIFSHGMAFESLSSKWVTFIIKITSLIKSRKTAILVSHGHTAIRIVIEIILLEVFFAIVSLPLRLVKQGDGDGAREQVKYKVKKVVSVSLLFIILIFWIVKLVLIGTRIWLMNSSQELTLTSVQESTEIGELEQQILDIQKADYSDDLSVPIIAKVLFLPDGKLQLRGESEPNRQIVLYMTKDRQDSSVDEPVIAIATIADNQGNFEAESNSSQFHLSTGVYKVRGVALDTDNEVYSATGPAISYELTQGQLRPAELVLKLDRHLNIVILIFITIGVISSILLI